MSQADIRNGNCRHTVSFVVAESVLIESSRSRYRPSWPISLAIASAAGISLGVVTQILQGVLPANAGTVLANSGATWAFAAFGVGALMSSDAKAAIAGALALVWASVLFYVAVDVFEGNSSDSTSAILWSLAGLVAGPLFGVAGHRARVSPSLRAFAWALVAGVLFAEGLHLIFWVGVDNLWPAGVAELVVATAITAWALTFERRIVALLAVTVAAGACHRIAYELLDDVARWL